MKECQHVIGYHSTCIRCYKSAQEIIDLLEAENAELKYAAAFELYEHYTTCDSEGLEWYGEIPPNPDEDKP